MTTRPKAPPAVRWITKTLEEAGHETWTVGGAVRDALLGRESGDWDLATRAHPAQVRKLFRRTVPIGIEHGTVGVLARDGTLYEVTTFRLDVETDGRHAVVAFADTLEDDLARRDFTINAIAWHAIREELADPFDGVGDLGRGVLRTVGHPEARFAEDYLRILRALRFAGRFELEIEPGTWTALCSGVDRLTTLSAERVREELIKVLDLDPDPERALELYAASGALRVLYPELEALRAEGSPVDGWLRSVRALGHLPVGRPFLRLAALLTGLTAEEVVAVLLRLRLSNAQVDEVARRAGAAPLPAPDAPAAELRRWLSAHGVQRLSAIARIQLARARASEGPDAGARVRALVTSWARARAVRAERPPLTVGALALDGRALIGLGLKPGPRFGDILDELLAWVLEDPSRNDPAILKERVLETEGASE